MTIPEKGQTALHRPTQTEFVVTRRTRREDGSIFLWHHNTPYPASDCLLAASGETSVGGLVVDVRSGHQATVVKIDGDYCFVEGQSLSGWVPVRYLRLSVGVVVESEERLLDAAELETLIAMCSAMTGEDLALLETLTQEQKRQLWGELSEETKSRLKTLKMQAVAA